MDLRCEEKEKRTLHWFVRGKQQKGFIKGVPDRVQFGVCYSISLLFSIYLFVFYICTQYQNESIDFMRLEELNEPTVQSLEGEQGYMWSDRQSTENLSTSGGGGVSGRGRRGNPLSALFS